MGIFEREEHPHIQTRKEQGPVKSRDVAVNGHSGVTKFNRRIAVSVTAVVGTMWCAYAFAGLAIISLPTSLEHGLATTIAWIAQTFLQLVLLSIIMVGQKVQSEADDKRAEMTFNDTEAILSSVLDIHNHLEAQDQILEKFRSKGVTQVDPS